MVIDDKRRLTEFLGECWHVPGPPTGYEHHRNRCLMCNRPLTANQFDPNANRLDFTDWRVTGRLIEKLQEQGITLELEFYEKAKKWYVALSRPEVHEIPKFTLSKHPLPMLMSGGLIVSLIGDTPQLAINEAVLVYLEEEL